MLLISSNDLNTMRSIINSTALAALTAWITASLCASVPRLLPSANTATELNKPEIDPPFSEAAQDRDFRKELMFHQWNYEDWGQHRMPETCVEEAMVNKMSGSDFRVRTVWYDDCEAAWVICRHVGAKESWDTILSVSISTCNVSANVVLTRPTRSSAKCRSACGNICPTSSSYQVIPPTS